MNAVVFYMRQTTSIGTAQRVDGFVKWLRPWLFTPPTISGKQKINRTRLIIFWGKPGRLERFRDGPQRTGATQLKICLDHCPPSDSCADEGELWYHSS